MKALLRAGAVAILLPLFFCLPLSAQTVTVTGTTQVTVQLGQPLFCSARWTAATKSVQLYCYVTKTTTWDTLVYNQVFPLNGLIAFEPIIVTQAAPLAYIHWMFTNAPTASAPSWALSYGSNTVKATSGGSGTFQ